MSVVRASLIGVLAVVTAAPASAQDHPVYSLTDAMRLYCNTESALESECKDKLEILDYIAGILETKAAALAVVDSTETAKKVDEILRTLGGYRSGLERSIICAAPPLGSCDAKLRFGALDDDFQKKCDWCFAAVATDPHNATCVDEGPYDDCINYLIRAVEWHEDLAADTTIGRLRKFLDEVESELEALDIEGRAEAQEKAEIRARDGCLTGYECLSMAQETFGDERERLLEVACNKENNSGCYLLAEVSEGPMRDHWLNRACDLRHKQACIATGRVKPMITLEDHIRLGDKAYRDGEVATAIYHYVRACDKGNRDRCYKVAQIMDEGMGPISANPEVAWDYFDRACLHGIEEACTRYEEIQTERDALYAEGEISAFARMPPPRCYSQGECHKKRDDDDRLIPSRYWALCQERRSAWFCEDLGLKFLGGEHGLAQDCDAALAVFERGCDTSGLIACNVLGQMYLEGVCVDEDPVQAFELIEKACAAYDTSGCANAAYLYKTGTGTEPNIQTALARYRMACHLDDEKSCEWGDMIEMRLGDYQRPANQCITDIECLEAAKELIDDEMTISECAEAGRMLNVACRTRSGEACYLLSKLHKDGKCGEEQPEGAYRAAVRGCDLNEPKCCAVAGLYNEKGTGTEVDLEKSLAFYKKSCEYNPKIKACNRIPIVEKKIAGPGSSDR